MMSKSRSTSEMEYKRPHEITSELLEARDQLRSHLALETALIERIGELPEEDFCHDARHSFQLGAGLAYQQRHQDVPAEDVFAVFFATQPQNRYLDRDVMELERKAVAAAAREVLETGELPQLESSVDQYQVEAAAAFAEGYLVASSMLRNEASNSEVA